MNERRLIPDYPFTGNFKCITPYYPSEVAQTGYPCGKCKPCMNSRQLHWVNRMKLETLGNSDYAFFVTLTYENESDYNNDSENLKLMFKRIRNAGYSLRYVFTTEFGTKKGRVHHHGIMWSNMNALEWMCRPKQANAQFAEKFWRLGFVKIIPMSSKTKGGYFSYITKYITKDKNPMVHSNKPKIGDVGIKWMKETMISIHSTKPFRSVVQFPKNFTVTLYNRQHKVFLTNALRRELKELFNIPYTLFGDTHLQANKIGNPNIPQYISLDRKLLEARRGT